ncbi:hypothetical protein G6L37_01020 [Agrobacterium rubi]|nr:hypothetical protein [Agrobacterium rubi]NTF23973.1 hypothetical protein [Agrobacterium rubi]
MSDLRDEVYEAMVELRPLVEERIYEWLAANPGHQPPSGVPLTTGFCRGVAAGVELILREMFPDCYWRVAGGFGVEYCTDRPDNLGDFADLDLFPGGMVNDDDEWHGHFWVTGGDPDGDEGVIVDLSADQFGHEPIVVTDSADVRYRENCLLGPHEKIRLSEHAWGTSLHGMWHVARKNAAPQQAFA